MTPGNGEVTVKTNAFDQINHRLEMKSTDVDSLLNIIDQNLTNLLDGLPSRGSNQKLSRRVEREVTVGIIINSVWSRTNRYL